MPKKEEKLTFKKVLNNLMEKSLQSLISVLGQESDHIIGLIKNIAGLGKKTRQLSTSLILFTAGVGVLAIGIAIYLTEIIPGLSSGISHILVGLIVILIAALYTKSHE